MIDIHSHILPAIDDGAQSLETALEMLERAVAQGTTIQYLTPHLRVNRFDNRLSTMHEHFAGFTRQVREAGIDIKLRLANEVHVGMEVMQWVAQDEVGFLGQLDHYKVFLLEFPTNDIPFGSDNLVRWLLQRDILPIIVHPERNRVFLKRPHKLDLFMQLGCPIQLTGSSILGQFGESSQAFCMEMLKAERVFTIASDAHNLGGRAPNLGDCRDYLGRFYSDHQLDKWFVTNPGKITPLDAQKVE